MNLKCLLQASAQNSCSPAGDAILRGAKEPLGGGDSWRKQVSRDEPLKVSAQTLIWPFSLLPGGP